MFTVFGSKGFIGSHLVKSLVNEGHEVYCPNRDTVFNGRKNLGNVIYCIGLTADFREKPFETIEAHVCKLNHLLQSIKFESFLYLSSTRIYQYSSNTNEEEMLAVNPNIFSDLYNISKIMGESICLAVDNPKVRVARLSNVVGNDFDSDNFITSLLRDGILNGEIKMGLHLDSCKDYIMIDDVVNVLKRISESGNSRIYNVASGSNISNKDIVKIISDNLNCSVKIEKGAKSIIFPLIDNNRLADEFKIVSRDILSEIPDLISKFKAINK